MLDLLHGHSILSEIIALFFVLVHAYALKKNEAKIQCCYQVSEIQCIVQDS